MICRYVYLFLKRHRYVVYQQFVCWTYGVLGKNIRVQCPVLFTVSGNDFHWRKTMKTLKVFIGADEDIVM